MTGRRYELIIAPTAKKRLAEQLPESVAFAAYEFIIGPLLDNPHRVGKQLRPLLHDRYSARRGTYRVLYRIDDERAARIIDPAEPGRRETGIHETWAVVRLTAPTMRITGETGCAKQTC